MCKKAHELLTEVWKNSVIPSEDIADPAVENSEGTLCKDPSTVRNGTSQ